MTMALVLPGYTQQFRSSEQPSVQFQSTSSMVGSGSAYSATPTIGANGTAYIPSSSPSKAHPGHIRKADSDRDGFDDETGLPYTPDNTGIEQPIGDGVVPFALCAIIYCLFLLRKRRTTSLEN